MKTFFYDLETFNPRQDRKYAVCWPALDMNLKKIGEPVNILIRLNDDVLPSPHALMVTKISRKERLKKATLRLEFAKMAFEDFFTPFWSRLATIRFALTTSICDICFGEIFTILTKDSGGKTDARNGIFGCGANGSRASSWRNKLAVLENESVAKNTPPTNWSFWPKMESNMKTRTTRWVMLTDWLMWRDFWRKNSSYFWLSLQNAWQKRDSKTCKSSKIRNLSSILLAGFRLISKKPPWLFRLRHAKSQCCGLGCAIFAGAVCGLVGWTNSRKLDGRFRNSPKARFREISAKIYVDTENARRLRRSVF